MNYDLIKDNTLLVTPYKSQFLKYISDNKILKNIKFITLDEFIKLVFFDYNEETIYYIMKNYNIGYYSSLEYIKSLYFIKDIDNEKIKFLLKLKQELIDNKLLKYKKINYKNIIIYGYDYIDSFYKKEFEKYNVKYINYDYKNNEIKDVYLLNNIYDEVLFVSEKIIDLINKGIDINKIKLLNLNDEYRKEIRKIFSLNNIPFTNVEISLYEIDIIKKYLENMDLNIFSNKDEIYEELIKVLNKYMWANNLKDVKELIIEDLKKTYINKKYDNEIKEVNINEINDDYVFLLNYHSESIPKIYMDIEYLTDEIKQKLGVDTSYIKNKYTRKELINKLKNIDNLIISCNKNNYISNLFDNINIINYENKYEYSNKSNNYNLGRMLDIYYKYGDITNGLSKLYNDFYKNYKNYDNKYKNINKENLLKYLDNRLLLSYTKLEDYYKCGFKYYIKYILKIEEYEEKLSTYLGNISHYILSKCFNNDFNLEIEFNKYLEENKKDFNNKELFFIYKLKQELYFIIEIIKQQYKYISLNNSLYEKEVFIENNNKIFTGKIDKLLYDDNNMAIIDYKTGNDTVDIETIKYGIGMQLPIYIYLSKHLFDKNIAGFYLQHILPSKKIDEEINISNYKLEGYSNSDIDILKTLDNTYENSELIKSLKMTKNGFAYYSKLLNNEQIESLMLLAQQKIEECFNNVFNGEFIINPKVNPKLKQNKDISCQYCKFKDLCFKEEKDNIYMEAGDE